MEEKKIIIIAGEASSDLHAANLIKEIKKINPQIKFYGLGGKQMKDAGAKIFYNIVDLAVVGFIEVLKNLNKFKAIFKSTLEKIDELKPNAVILIDYPGFNLRLVKELSKRNIKVIYYISPQIWAWGKNRIKLIKKYVNKMIVIFKFEEELYKKHGVDTSFVGHPLLDVVKPTLSKEEFLKSYGLSDEHLTIALLPGSREKEIERLLPVMLETAKILHQNIPQTQFIILKAPSIEKELIKKSLFPRYRLPIKIIEDKTYDGLASSDFAIVASGTATLETAISKIPMVVIYRVSFLTWLFLKPVIQIPHIALVNVVADKKIVPEYLQYNAKPKRIANEIIKLLYDKERLSSLKKELDYVKNILGEPGANQRTAKVILESI